MIKNLYGFIFKFRLILIIAVINLGNCINESEGDFVIIPFKLYYPKDDEIMNVNKQLVTSWVMAKLYLDIENESGQKLQMILNNEEPQMHTGEGVALYRVQEEENYKPYNKKVDDMCTFEFQKSNTYQCTSAYDHTFYSRENCCYAKEKMQFYTDFNLKEKKSFDISFIHSSNATHICFFSCLQLTESPADQPINMFYQIKHLINSNKYTWMLKFNSPDDGYFIFGDIINNNKLKFYNDNNEDNFIPINIPPILFKIYWKLPFKKLFIGEYIINLDSYFSLNFETRYITVPYEYFYEIKKQYLLTNENLPDSVNKFICFDEESNLYFHSVYCDKKEYLALTDNYKKLPTLNLLLNNYNISFTPQELFIENGDKIFFFIAYNKHAYEGDWYIGNIFLEKYITVFNNDARQLNILKRNLNINPEPDTQQKNDENNSTFKIVLIVILVFILTALIFGFLGIFYGKKWFQNRRKIANELEDENYEYLEKSINK